MPTTDHQRLTSTPELRSLTGPLSFNRKAESKTRTATALNENAAGLAYHSDSKAVSPTGNNLNFRIATEPFNLPTNTLENLHRHGTALTAYYHACDRLFWQLPKESWWHEALMHSCPDWIKDLAKDKATEASHVFIRPDFILTANGPIITEIETSPFGPPLSIFLNAGYQAEGHRVLTPAEETVSYFIAEVLGPDYQGKTMAFVLTDHTQKYSGQFEYLAKLLADRGVVTHVVLPEAVTIDPTDNLARVNGQPVDIIYRGFYLHEVPDNPALIKISRSSTKIVPGFKSHLEEKALLALIWDESFSGYLKQILGTEIYQQVKTLIPPTYIFKDAPPTDFPVPIANWEDLANLSAKNRNYLLKVSGFSPGGSWAKGIKFLGKLSRANCLTAIREALQSGNVIIQEFREGSKFDHEYYDFATGQCTPMTGKVRLTPYYATRDGRLLSAKITMRSNTGIIHASTDSINAPLLCAN